MLNELLGKPLNEEYVDYELSMLDETDGEINAVFLVGVYRIPYEIGAEDDDDFYYHEVLGVYAKDGDGEALNHAFYEACAATKKYIYFWVPWSEEYENMLSPAFIEETEDGIRHLYRITFSNQKSKYKNEDA